MTETTNLPWLRKVGMRVSRDDRGEIVGVFLTCLVLHEDLTTLPPDLMDGAHRLLDRAAANDAARDSGGVPKA